ncbi:MAG: S8 family serine peptidase [Candidatus Thiodiazotropha sp.]
MKAVKSFSPYICASLLCMSMAMPGFSLAAGFHSGMVLKNSSEAKTNRIIVKYHQSVAGTAAIADTARQFSLVTGLNVAHEGSTGSGAQILNLDEMLPLEEVQEIAKEIETYPNVEYAEADKRIFPLYTPTDPRYNEQWHYYNDTAGIRLPDAWDSSRGEDVIVAVIDTGYTDHRDMMENLQLPGYDMINSITMANDGDGRDQDAHDPGDWSPYCGMPRSSWHGTHTAGTVAAVGDNGIGVIGVAFNAKVLPVRVLGKCGGWMSEFADGIVWAAGGNLSGIPTNQTPAQVINMSLGGPSSGCSQYLQDAVDRARQLGTTLVVAAGNESMNVAGVEPANCNGVITVAATDRRGNRARFSNYGNLVDIAAPGVGVLSTLNTGATTPENDTYAYYSGTSMAAPHVSGVAALLYAIKPDITPDEVEQILKESARPFPGTCTGCGTGLLDAAAAVAAVDDTPPTPPDIHFENSSDYTIPDFSFSGVKSPIDVPHTGSSGMVSVDVDIKHSFMREVLVRLIAPNGQGFPLSVFEPGTDLLQTYNLDLGNTPASGRWALQVFDLGFNAQGYIDSWSITFQE